MALQQLPHEIGVAVRADLERRPCRNGAAMARRQIVEDNDVVPGLDEPIDRHRADIAGATGYENAHEDLQVGEPLTDGAGRGVGR